MANINNFKEQYLKMDELCDYLKIKKSTVYKYMKHKKMPTPIKPFGVLLWNKEDVNKWVEAVYNGSARTDTSSQITDEQWGECLETLAGSGYDFVSDVYGDNEGLTDRMQGLYILVNGTRLTYFNNKQEVIEFAKEIQA